MRFYRFKWIWHSVTPTRRMDFCVLIRPKNVMRFIFARLFLKLYNNVSGLWHSLNIVWIITQTRKPRMRSNKLNFVKGYCSFLGIGLCGGDEKSYITFVDCLELYFQRVLDDDDDRIESHIQQILCSGRYHLPNKNSFHECQYWSN